MIRVELNLLAERADRLDMTVGSGVCQPQVIPSVFNARIRIHRAFQQLDRPAIILALQRFHSRSMQLRGSSFHLRSRRLRPLPRRRQDRARQQLVLIALRCVAKRFVVRTPRCRQLIHLDVQFTLTFQESLVQRVRR